MAFSFRVQLPREGNVAPSRPAIQCIASIEVIGSLARAGLAGRRRSLCGDDGRGVVSIRWSAPGFLECGQ
jgi:hypothetical protein